jgi:DNA-binding transcriptional LysR family regulator
MIDSTITIAGLSLDRLLSLCQVAEAGSIGQAAGGDANRQSQFSRQISELESHFGIPLLERSRRPHRLNASGKRLAASTRLFLKDLEVFRTQATDGEWRMVIGAGESLIQGLLMPASEKVRQRNAKVKFAFRNLTSEKVLSQLQIGEIDLGVLREEEVTPMLATSPALTYDYEAWVPLALNRTVGVLRAVELGAMPWAVLEGKGHFRRFLRDASEAAGVRLNIGIECSSYSQIASAVGSGRYAGFLPSFHQMEAGGDNQFIQRKAEKGLRYQRSMVLAWLPRAVEWRPAFSDVVNQLQRAISAADGVKPMAQQGAAGSK